MADVTKRLDAERHDHEGSHQHLATALRLLAGCATVYERTDNHGKRLANQAFYQRILINEDEKAAIQLNEPFAAFALTSTDVTSDLVELTGFEPVTFCMPCRRATNCAIAPNFLGVAVATPAILHAHWAAAKSGGRFSDVSLTHPAPSRARLTSTTAR